MHKRKGTITIETAIGFTIFLIFIASIISVAQFYRTNILMQRSVEQSCEKVSLLTPLSIQGSSIVSTVTNLLPDMNYKEIENVTNVLSYISGIDDITGNPIEELVLEGALAPYMASDIYSRYIELNNNSKFFAPEFIDVQYDIDTKHSCIDVTVNYSVSTICGTFERNVFSIIPIYGEAQYLLYGEDSKKDSDIWSSDNFTRGNYFRNKEGANLPSTFPVIDSYESGLVKSIRSIDLTAPKYQFVSGIDKEISEEINKLANFNGASVKISNKTYNIPKSAINKKKLVIIIPSNTDEDKKSYIKTLIARAMIKGVSLEIKERGESYKYK